MPIPEQARAAALGQRGGEEGEGGVLGQLGRSPSGPSTGSSPPPTAACSSSTSTRSRPRSPPPRWSAARKTQVAHLPAARGLRRLRGGRAAPACSPRRRRVGEEAVNHLKAPSVDAGQARTWCCCRPTSASPSTSRSATPPSSTGRSATRPTSPAPRSCTARQAGQVPGRRRHRQLPRRPHLPESLSTCGYDDDGVKTTRVPHHREGRSSSATRPSATRPTWSARRPRRGCCYADSLRLGPVPAHAQRLAGARRRSR